MQRQLKVIAPACLLVVLFVVGVQLLFTRQGRTPQGGTPSEAEFENEFRDIFNDLTFGYLVRDNVVVSRLDPRCRSLLDNSTSSCVEFVDSLREIDPLLATSLERLNKLLDTPAPNVSQEVMTSAHKALNRYTVTHEANLLLLDGWDSGDQAKWVRGSDLRESLKNATTSFEQ